MLTEVLTGKLTFTSLKPCDFTKCTKREIAAYFENSYDLNESIFTSLKDRSGMYKCPDRLRLPLIFYYGHTACVYMNKLILAGFVKPEERVKLEFESLFETGVDEMSWDDTENYRLGGKFQWPQLSEVVEYRRDVREVILKAIDRTELELPILKGSEWWGLFMGMEHERIHLETSTVLLRQLPVAMLETPSGWTTAPTQPAAEYFKNPLLTVKECTVTLGKPDVFPSYGWDNEYGHLECKVPAFQCNKYEVTNREFLDFVLDGGYETRKWWSEEGWAWVKYKQAKHPAFWMCSQDCKSGCGGDLAGYSHCSHKFPNHLNNGQNGYCNGHSSTDSNGHQGKDEGGGPKNVQYRFRVMFSELPEVPWDWPVEVNYLEAKAYCAWRGDGYRLPCEAEHQAIRGKQLPVSDGTKCDIIYQDDTKSNINMVYGSSTSVTTYPPNSAGFHDVFGNVWEWMEDHFNGLPGFKTDPFYDDFSTPTFDGRHNVILGGSWVSTGSEASRFARFAFRRHFYQHCGFRLVRSLDHESQIQVHVPTRIIRNQVYVLGAGFSANPLLLDSKISFVSVDSTNTQYLYEREEVLNENLKFEYGQDVPIPVIMAQKAAEVVKKYSCPHGNVLHLGANSGRCSFELTKTFDQVLGQDFCGIFLDSCLQIQQGKRVTYTSFDGFKKSRMEVTLPKDTDPDRVTFSQLTWLPNEVGFFDFILAGCFDRVQSVEAWTLRIPHVLRANGLLMIVSVHWTSDKLTKLLTPRLVLVEQSSLCYTYAGQPGEVNITVWKHAVKQ